ncbi:MAG: nickel/cobalt transporter [Rhizobiaceae bacterium]
MQLTVFATRTISAILLLLISLAFLLWTDLAVAQNSLGIGRPEPAIKPEGPFASLLFWIQQQQQDFYRLMTEELRQVRAEGKHIWLLAGVSFLYGIFHAAGPGHGKAVISSFMLANEVAAKRGIVLAFAASFLQAATAIILIFVLTFVIRGMGIRQGDVTKWLEIASYAGVTALGAWLLFTKITGRSHHNHSHDRKHEHGHDHDHAHQHEHEHAHALANEHALAHETTHGHEHVHAPTHGHSQGHGHSHIHCGHSHAPDPEMLSGDLSLRQAWSAILAVGLRPCTGAIIVLTFAFLNGLFVAGIASTFAMALGTGITVATLAALAVWAKDIAIDIGGATDRAEKIHRIIEIGGATLVFLLGILLLSASLY